MKNILLIKNIIVIVITLFIAIFIFKTAPYYEPREKFEEGVTRLVVDSKDITNSIKNNVFVEDDVIMMPSSLAIKYFNIYVYYDEPYDTVIITSATDVGKVKLGENRIYLNGNYESLKGTVKKINDVLYVPISSLDKFYDATVYFDEKVIVTTTNGWERIHTVKVSEKEKLKSYKKELSRTTGIAEKDELLYLFDEQTISGDYIVARNERGDIGYIKLDKVKNNETVANLYTKPDEVKRKEKISLAWEYAENFTPDRTGEAKIEGLNILSPTWLYLSKDYTLKTTTDSNYIRWARSRNYELWPTLKNDGRSLEEVSKFVNDMKARESFINEVTSYAVKNGFEGVNIDFEYMYKKDKDVFSEFVRELSADLRRNNIIVSVDVTVPGGSDNYSLCYDRPALAKAVDYMMLMAYDQYGTWCIGTEKHGPTASLEWVESNLETMLGYEGVSKEKLVLCIPFYYRSWLVNKDTGKTKTTATYYIKGAKDILEKYKNIAVWDEVDGQYYIETPEGTSIRKIWVESAESLKKKLEAAKKYDLAGIAAWRLGYESSEEWKIINNEYMK